MGRHSPSKGAGSPSTGDGRTGGAKPQKSQCTQQTSTGAVLWKATAQLFGASKKK
jgi:hypothetical protein